MNSKTINIICLIIIVIVCISGCSKQEIKTVTKNGNGDVCDKDTKNKIDYKQYLGEWISSSQTEFEEDIWGKGGNILEIEDINNEYLRGNYVSVQSSSANRIADFKFEGKIIGNKVKFKYEDSFHTKGEGILKFKDDKIEVDLNQCTISEDNTSGWCARGGTLIRSRIQKNRQEQSEIELGAAKADTFYVEEVIRGYENSMIDAINQNDFSLVEKLLLPNSNLYKSQKKLILNLHERGITEKLIDYDIVEIEGSEDGNIYKVYTTEKIEIKYSKQNIKIKDYTWIYTVFLNLDTVKISDIEKWNR
ncbi:MAG: hypothetical protein N4A63_01580 [Vallitalea sp.]|jgi:hypothetical protein|nr:hypothetical protein [Vallitalea sp.]